jgi:GAF domain-containing protein
MNTAVLSLLLVLAAVALGLVLRQIGNIGRALLDAQQALIAEQSKFKEFSADRARFAAIAAELQQAETFEALARTYLSRTVEMIGAHYGVVYVLDEATQRLIPVGAYGAQHTDAPARSFGLGEGLVGQCAQDQQGVTVLQLPDTPLRIVSGIGNAIPRQVLLQSLVQKDKVVGVLEFAAITAFDEKTQYLLEELMPTLAMSMVILNRNGQRNG